MAEEARKATRNWLLRHSIDTAYSPEKFEKYLFCPVLAARTFPDASWKGLDLSSKFMTFTWLMDDLFDDIDINKSWEPSLSLCQEISLVMKSTFPKDQTIPECLRRVLELYATSDRLEATQNLVINELFKNDNEAIAVFPGKLSQLGSAFREIWDEIVAELPHTMSSLRIARHFQMFFISSLIQIQNNKDKVIPSLDDYVLIRRGASSVVPFVAIADLTEGVVLPEDIFSNPQMQRLIDLVTDFASWHNDIWSFKKEYLINGDVHNLVFLISHHCNCSFEEAALTITKMLYVLCAEMEVATKEVLKVTPPQHQHAAARYIATCRHWVSGTDDWHKKNLHYK